MGQLRASLTGGNRAIALWIIACALMLRILVPAGWMPTVDSQGMTRISLCTGQGMVEAFVDREGKVHEQAPGKSQPRTDQPCAFAGLGFALAEPVLPLLLAPVQMAATAIVSPPATISAGRGLAAPPPPATGPPAIL